MDESREREVRDRIVSLMQASEPGAPTKQITSEELENLQNAAKRLDQMSKDAADADVQALRIAAERLDQLLKTSAPGKTSQLISRAGETRTTPSNRVLSCLGSTGTAPLFQPPNQILVSCNVADFSTTR
jgi:hypothetical protein